MDKSLFSCACRQGINFAVRDVRFWILLFFLLRLIGITQPPLEVAHNWRQTTVTMVSRNFYETDARIWLPKVDMAGEKSGITGMEFPLFNYLIYLMSLLFGYTHWYGRLINLVISSAGIWAFYRLVKRFLDEKTAFNATLILLPSLWLMYSRKIMPDTFSVALVVLGLDAACRWLYDRKAWPWLCVAALLIAAGLLSKVPAGLALALLPFLLLDKTQPVKRRLILFAVSTAALLPTLWWYAFQVPFLNEKGGFVHFFMGKPFLDGAAELMERIGLMAGMFYDIALKFSGFALFLIGLVSLFFVPDKKLLVWFLLSSLLFLGFMFRAGENFVRHSYYMVPFIPVMAVVAALGLSRLSAGLIPNAGTKRANVTAKPRLQWLPTALLALVILEGVLNQQHDLRIKDESKALLRLETLMDSLDPSGGLVAVNSGQYPTPLYFAHRKGWLLENHQMANEKLTDSLKTLGLKKIIVLKKAFGTPISLNKTILYDDADFSVYEP